MRDYWQRGHGRALWTLSPAVLAARRIRCIAPMPIMNHNVTQPITETLYPESQTSAGPWRNLNDFSDQSDLDEEIDETTPFDSTGITTESSGGGRFLEDCDPDGPTDDVVGTWPLPVFTDTPNGSETFVLEIRSRLKETFIQSPPNEPEVEVELILLQGASSIVNTARPIHGPGTGFGLDSETLSAGEVTTLLSDTGDMRLRIIARGCIQEVGDEADVEVSMARLRVFP